jgi:trans-aconitate 2-methyltransferase
MSKQDWNPDLYLKFDKERIQPSIDLVSRILIDNVSKIIDIGCGPGNSTQVLVQRWPHSQIIGVDNSPSMIEKAKKDYPNQNWEILDAGKEDFPDTYDIIFSNATIQWIPDHDQLFRKFFLNLNEKGLIAIQIPLFWDMPLAKAIEKIAMGNRWKSATKEISKLFTIHNYSYYFDQLSIHFDKIDIWETYYMHIMDSHVSILEMIRSTGLKPYLDGLETDNDKKDFEAQVLTEITKDYPKQKNGKVIFPFKRLFFIAKK